MLKRKWSNKQYCGDVESDPFDFAYRGSVFDPFKESNKVPTVEEHTQNGDPIDPEDLIENIQLPAHRLSAKVRQQYLYYLERVLRENYGTWLGNYNNGDNPFTDDEVRQCAETIEMRAVQGCMITSLYRRYILEKIGEIRKQTGLGVIHPNLTDTKFQPALVKREQCHVGVQTDSSLSLPPSSIPMESTLLQNVPMISLEEKMLIFNRNSIPPEQSPVRKTCITWKAPPADTFSVQNATKASQETVAPILDAGVEIKRPRNDTIDDEILKELQAMFEPADGEENIFEWSEDQAQVKAIISETENADPLQSIGGRTGELAPNAVASPCMDRTQTVPAVSNKDVIEPVDLRCSMWPCELHMQRMRLRNVLVQLAEGNYRRYEWLVQTKFVTLFGVDDGEEQDLGPYSPSIELNEVLVSSCRQRIAQWVVKALMRPLNEGLIANRFLFKKLAKRLADGIIYLNQYPDQKFIRNYINDYFCSHVQIRSIDDIT
uniref:Uncharacterized protein n=1 Tax=Anopheles dirus TaxID=7168 RepID=A0A182NSM7_9DIPT